ncbi:uncharacterized protein VP01_1351g4 [Puccinia sorghi]|uniref:Uncharacterized protein n=1 Tax=Puccinia sorghi TaxID=27349 RepID=A0A0L6VNS4_9BASI|nr:uncharacterized protein VP01_1351g4 [Puccinia sorghi]
MTACRGKASRHKLPHPLHHTSTPLTSEDQSTNPKTPTTPNTPAPQVKTIKKKAVPWDRNGIDGGSTSMEIFLNWLTTGTNYQCWRGDLEEGKTKKSLCLEIIQMMNDNGITHRDARGIDMVDEVKTVDENVPN